MLEIQDLACDRCILWGDYTIYWDLHPPLSIIGSPTAIHIYTCTINKRKEIVVNYYFKSISDQPM